MKVPFVDLAAQYRSIKTEIDNAIFKVINETAFIGGRYVEQFEKEFAALYGVKHCISVANGTDSLFIIMKMLGIGRGDEVITVANSWISSSETISQTGAKPVFVDIDSAYFSINENLIERFITPSTKAILPVHLHGQMCDMDAIMAISKKYKITVIEDCAQSHFSEYKGRRAGTFGSAASFSFYPGKNLGAYGDAGCILTNDDTLAVKFKMYARHGALKKHEHQIEGINSRMDGLQAAILTSKLPFILDWTKQRIEIAKLYDVKLKEVQEIELPIVRPESQHSFHLYVIKSTRRNELVTFLKQNGIETAIHYPVALPNMVAYNNRGYLASDFLVSTAFQDVILSLPMFPELTVEQVDYVCSKIKDFYNYQTKS